MVINRKAQFFLLAAVIIVVVVISLGVTTNQAIVNKEPESFYEFSYTVNQEVGEVIDYAIYSDFDDDANLDEFVDLLMENIGDKEPDANFIVIYGDNVSGMEIRNEGINPVSVEEEEIEGSKKMIVNRVCHDKNCEDVSLPSDTYDENIGKWKIESDKLEGKNSIEVDVNEQTINFPISRHKKVFFIMQKDVGDESFVSIN